jgi:hypothetical protein
VGRGGKEERAARELGRGLGGSHGLFGGEPRKGKL